ncbi:MAG: hypothetical protein QQN51_07855 [Nitrosopumilus sp.]
MKYKVGDRVKIKTWKNMEEEYGLNKNKNLTTPQSLYIFSKEKEKYINVINFKILLFLNLIILL